MRNIKSIISGHNKRLLNQAPQSDGCNCRKKAECPLENKFLTSSLIYKSEITNNIGDKRKIYIGASETTFKERYRNHIKDIKNKNTPKIPNYPSMCGP